LTQRTRSSNQGIVIGFEQDEYLGTKGKKILRPWELIVTVSIFAHIAQIYKIPLRLFIMPSIPENEEEFDDHYMDIYKRVLEGNPRTPIVITLGDIHRQRKINRMISVGLQPQDWLWTDIKLLILSPSTGLILVETEDGYRSIVNTSLDLHKPSDNIPIPFFSSLSLWEDLYKMTL